MGNELINVRLGEGGDAVVILDQTLLPGQTKYITLRGPEEMHEAIKMLRVRGAPAIGIFAAYALYVIARGIETRETESQGAEARGGGEFIARLKRAGEYLRSSRPTAVNLAAQLARMESVAESMAGAKTERILEALREEADRIRDEDIEMCRAISGHGLALLREGDGVLTHCNAGPLATSRYGTALGPLFLARERGMRLNIYCCETRPLLQGARLTAFELDRAGIACTLICDNMASIVMKEGRIQAVFAGSDRVAMNGDAANKIGTSGLAILAKHYGIPFYIFCPSSTLDPGCATGEDIEIELRRPDEIKELYFRVPTAPPGVGCYNPAFDVTDNSLITGIVTEAGTLAPPFEASLRGLLRR